MGRLLCGLTASELEAYRQQVEMLAQWCDGALAAIGMILSGGGIIE